MRYASDGDICRNITINSYVLPSEASEDGIGLTPDLKYVYYCPMASCDIYRIATEYLNDEGYTTFSFSLSLSLLSLLSLSFAHGQVGCTARQG